jgi:hypothetical protein
MLEHSSPVKGAAGNVRLSPGTGKHSGHRTLPGAAAFWILAGPEGRRSGRIVPRVPESRCAINYPEPATATAAPPVPVTGGLS